MKHILLIMLFAVLSGLLISCSSLTKVEQNEQKIAEALNYTSYTDDLIMGENWEYTITFTIPEGDVAKQKAWNSARVYLKAAQADIQVDTPQRLGKRNKTALTVFDASKPHYIIEDIGNRKVRITVLRYRSDKEGAAGLLDMANTGGLKKTYRSLSSYLVYCMCKGKTPNPKLVSKI